MLFAGDPVRWPEADDVAVILPELVKAFPGELRGAVVARAAEEALKGRFGVAVFPSIAVVRRRRDARRRSPRSATGPTIAPASAPRSPGDAEPREAGAGPKTEIRFVGARSDA